MRVGKWFHRKEQEAEKAPWRVLLELSFTELDRQLHRDTIERLFEEIEKIPDYELRIPELTDDDKESLSYAFRAMQVIERSNARKHTQAAYYQSMVDRYVLLRGKAERDRVMLDFLSILDDDPRRLRGDAKAFKQRWADFGLVTERHQRIVLREEMLQELCLDIVAKYVSSVLSTRSELTEENVGFAESVLKALNLEQFLTEIMNDSRRWQTQIAAFDTLAKIVHALPQGAQFRILSLETSALVMRFCTDPNANVWQQISAIGLLAQSDPLGVMDVIQQRLLADELPIKSDDLFVRRGIIEIIGREFSNEAGFDYLAQLVRKRDPSDYVRMKLVQTIATFKTVESRAILHDYVRGEPDETSFQVRAQAAFEWGTIGRDAVDAGDDALLADAIRELAWAIAEGDDTLLRRAALEEAARIANHRETVLEKRRVDELDKTILDAIQTVFERPTVTASEVNWAADAWVQVVVGTMPDYYLVRDNLEPRLEQTYSGQSFTIARDQLPVDEDALGLILAYLTRRDFGVYVAWHEDHARVYRGNRMRLSLWRILYEVRNPNPAKRQAVRHTVARRFDGTIRAHSGILAEITQTKVPGEPLYLANEGSWRRYLPLVDDYLSMCRRSHAGRVVRLYSSFGITTIRGPADPMRCWRNFFLMSWKYRDYAELRNANPLHKQYSDAREYVEAVNQRFGIETRFIPYSYEYEGERVELRVPTVQAVFETR
jgi:hypothetical protein